MSNIRPYLDTVPQVHGSCYLDPLCLVAGDVVLAEECRYGRLPYCAGM